MTEIPQAAIDAAKVALIDRYDVPNEQLDEAWLTRDAQIALEAAAPLIAAAERDRIEGLFGEWVGILMQEPNSHPPEAWRSGFADLIRASDAEA